MRKGCELPGQLGVQDLRVAASRLWGGVATGGLTLSPFADLPLAAWPADGRRVASSDGEASFRIGREETKEASSFVFAARFLHVSVPTGVSGGSGAHGDRFDLPCLFLCRNWLLRWKHRLVSEHFSYIFIFVESTLPSITNNVLVVLTTLWTL